MIPGKFYRVSCINGLVRLVKPSVETEVEVSQLFRNVISYPSFFFCKYYFLCVLLYFNLLNDFSIHWNTHERKRFQRDLRGIIFIVHCWCQLVSMDEVPYMYVCMTQSSIQKKMLINSNSECWREVSLQFMCSKI